MIKRAYSAEELSALPRHGVEAQKIRALLLAYGTKYDFCRFYVSKNTVFCEMDGSFVLCETRKPKDSYAEELAGFLELGGFADIFCSAELGEQLSVRLSGIFRLVRLMRFCGKPSECADVDKTPPLEEVYQVLSTAFDIEHDAWYADMSHRIRHGVARARLLDGSALIVQHEINGEALLSQIATIPEKRGRGNAARLIRSVCAELSESAVYVVCEEDLISFYQSVGFEPVGEKFIITK